MTWMGWDAVEPPVDPPPVTDPELEVRVKALEDQLIALKESLKPWVNS